ncbi:2,3-diphosphoglycerate synthetase [Thermococcus sp. M36]|uniref:2,3-diphosphoglycerate synthetase n=1 Tax=Thermococcus sp. M36 TaxID=1638261 RepID=UPI00143B65C3|nr:2,3-diphosphoglycerate synthetase [Thermococcus sp. M36]NJE04578.1 2,3-diphosphoglycerate synthetase [Thermococcus sp. M36]
MRGKGKLALIDGEHYPDVIAWALQKLGDVCCAVFLGGTEKIGNISEIEEKIGVKIYHAPDYLDAIRAALTENEVTEVVDLSDEPVINYEDRFRIASICMLHGVPYRGADFQFFPRPMKRANKPTLAVIGTGKRVGKTAVSGFIARILKGIARPVIVTMGRGGPAEPEVIDGERFRITPDFLVKLAENGRHAASDHFEDALTAGVTTIGCRRCGGGMAGFSFFDVIDEGVKLAESLPHDLIILEGSGATFPSYRADGYILITSARGRPDFLRGYFGPFRVALADIVVVTMADSAGEDRLRSVVDAIRSVNRDADIHLTAFQPRPLGDVSGKRLGLVMTSADALLRTAERLEAMGAEVVAVSANLSRRELLVKDLEGFGDIEAVAVELKAAAVDVVTKWALERGLEVIYLDNEPVNVDGKDLRGAVLELGRRVLEGWR